MWMRIVLVAAFAGVAGCGGDGDGDGPTADMGVMSDGPSDDAGGGCQPSNVHEELLMASTEADVVRKVPTHPPVGDGGLP
jgi:hypothetical protein